MIIMIIIRPYSNQQKKKRTCKCVGFCCTAWPHNKTERKWKMDECFDLARELKKLWNMKVMIVPIVIGAFAYCS